MAIDPGTSSVVASSFCSVEFLGRVHRTFSLSRCRWRKRFFYPSPRICSSFQNREEPQAYFEKRFFLLLALQKVKMVLLKTLWQFDDSCYGYVEAKQYHFMHKCNSTLYYTHFEITGGPCNLIGSNWCDLFTNRITFCFKLHLFPSQWGGYTKNKTINQIQGLFKVTNQIAGKWKTKSIMWQILQLLFPKLLFFSSQKMDEFNFKSA